MSIVVALLVAFLVVHFWHEWTAAIIVIIAAYFMGNFWYTTRRTSMGSAISIGILCGVIASIVVLLVLKK